MQRAIAACLRYGALCGFWHSRIRRYVQHHCLSLHADDTCIQHNIAWGHRRQHAQQCVSFITCMNSESESPQQTPACSKT